MPYIDSDYYKTTYLGKDPGDSSELARLIARASDDVDLACRGPVAEGSVLADVFALVKKATAAQVEYYVLNGDGYNEDQTVGGESIGGWSRQVNLTQQRPAMSLCPRAQAYIDQTGLNFAGVRVCHG
jgi:hypothetical protein